MCYYLDTKIDDHIHIVYVRYTNQLMIVIDIAIYIEPKCILMKPQGRIACNIVNIYAVW